MSRRGLRVVQGGTTAAPHVLDPELFQAQCLEDYAASQVARSFSPITIESGSGVLERFLNLCERPVWEVTREDVDRVVGHLAKLGLSASTRRGYVQAFKGFHRFLRMRKAAEIEVAFGVRLEDPVDEFNASQAAAYS